jgi:hypothetical protein
MPNRSKSPSGLVRGIVAGRIRAVVKPSTAKSVATIEIEHLSDELLSHYMKVLAEAGEKSLPLELEVESAETLTPEARKRVRKNVLVSST